MRHSVEGTHMSKFSTITFRAGFAAAAISLLLPATGFAHALFADNNPNRPVAEYLWLGFVHMVGGWDHLLFIAGVVLLAGSLRSAAKLISLFVAGHSLTLIVATLAGWQLNATAVDVVIALSVVFVGVQGLRGRPRDLALFGGAVFGFGLVHGLGLSTRLQDLGLPEDGLLVRVVLFNVGVELGQLAALGLLFGLGTLFAMRLRGAAAGARRHGFGALALSGLLAAAVLAFPRGDATDQQAAVAKSRGAEACVQQDAQPPRFIGGDHPEKWFFGPREQAPVEDLAHVIGDGLVILRYHPQLAETDVEKLRTFVNEPASNRYVIGAPDP